MNFVWLALSAARSQEYCSSSSWRTQKPISSDCGGSEKRKFSRNLPNSVRALQSVHLVVRPRLQFRLASGCLKAAVFPGLQRPTVFFKVRF